MQSTMQQLMKRRMIFLLLLDGRCIDARFNQQIGCCLLLRRGSSEIFARICSPNNVIGERRDSIRI